MLNKTKYEIEIVEGNEHHSKIMDIYDAEGFFYDSFKQAALAVTEIVSLSSRFNQECKGLQSGNFFPAASRRADVLSEYDNNIVSFCADRGQGKTSAMLSMADALTYLNGREKTSDVLSFWNSQSMRAFFRNGNNPVLSKQFVTLDLIDPTRMEKNDSIIRIIISKMFKAASEKWESFLDTSAPERRDIDRYRLLQQRLADKFLDCFKGLDYLYRSSETVFSSYDDLNMLAEYGDSNNFRMSFFELIRLYLEFMAPNQDIKETMLIILVDDADLNTKNAYAISEDIRKYCILPNVMVFMAVHIGTLSRSIEQYYLDQYRTLIELGRDETVRNRCHKIMEQSIDKLMPSSHRIYLNSIYHSLRDEYDSVKLSYLDKDNNDMLSGMTLNKNAELTYEEQLIALVYRKTGIILTKSELHLHDFLPDNFRELNHFLFYMMQLQDVIKIGQDGKNIGTIEDILERVVANLSSHRQEEKKEIISEIDFQINNLELFSNYFINTWCPLHLDYRQIRIIEDMRKSSRIIKNRRTIDILREYAQEISINLKTKEQCDLDYYPLSDVIFTLYGLTDSQSSIKYSYLAYAIRMYYTIYLHKIVLRSIASWLQLPKSVMQDVSPFKDLTDAFCGNFIPLQFRQTKNLPFQLLRFSKDYAVSSESSRLLFHFMCEGRVISGKRSAYRESAASRRQDNSNTTYLINFRRGVMKKTEEKYKFRSDYQCFDVFKPFLSLLESNEFVTNFEMGADKARYYSIDVPCSLINLLCNLDLLDLLYHRYFSKKTDVNPNLDSSKKFFDYVDQVYQAIDTDLAPVLPDGVTVQLKHILKLPDTENGFPLSDFELLDSIKKPPKRKNAIFDVYPAVMTENSSQPHPEKYQPASQFQNAINYLQQYFVDGYNKQSETGTQLKFENLPRIEYSAQSGIQKKESETPTTSETPETPVTLEINENTDNAENSGNNAEASMKPETPATQVPLEEQDNSDSPAGSEK